MSRKTRIKSSLRGAIAKMGGAHLTLEARKRTTDRFVEICFSNGFVHLTTPLDIVGKHLRSYFDVRIAEGIQARTLQNEASHLRGILRAVGRNAVANEPKLTNAALGINGGSRIGKKRAMTAEELDCFVQLSNKLKRPGIGALLCLEWHLGLRGNEAIHAPVDTLERWDDELGRSGKIIVLAGAKGGRTRTVNICDVDAAQKAVRNALAIAREQGEFLVARRDGKPVGGLKQARCIYHSWCQRNGIVPHAARYAFAQAQFATYRRKGYGKREALIAVSRDLGHGDGRGRWIKMVYGQRPAQSS